MSGNPWLDWWQEADWVVQAVFLLLLALSVLSWTVIVAKAIQFLAVLRGERWTEARLEAGEEPDADSLPSGRLAAKAAGLGAHQRMDRERLGSYLGAWLNEQRLILGNNLTLLATIGNAAPFIGLFGTVWGIMNALRTLGGGAGLTLEAVAGPVGEALVATAAGLFTAIPAVIGYNLLVRWQNRIMALVSANTQVLLDRTPSYEAP
ncbi:MAG: MotA/TolQ/ExbB proton channel family protein [Thiohalorhabdus sp.]|uniref:MotA/TolQ/ExbB proton channel family protein n=1 Tax=Thiohalorhabdus sp. TaxID=3094134 RepID=UPI002FC2D469